MEPTHDNSQPIKPKNGTAKPAPWTKTLAKPHAKIQAAYRRRAAWLGVVFALLLAAGSGFAGGYFGYRANHGVNTSSIEGQQQVVSSESQLIANIAKTVGPSVVSVDVVGQTSGNSMMNLYGMGMGSQTQASAGTGIILSSDGIIITNRHVVPAGTQSVNVTLSDGTVFKDVQVLGRTNSSDSLDIAFLKIKDLGGKQLTPATLGDSSKTVVGDRVVAIGNALGQFQNTVTSGIVSGFGRSVEAGSASSDSSESLQDLIQTDAAINEGNSGGPLVNMSGQVIGINTAIASDSQNIGFAIPINDVQGLIKQVLQTGGFQRPYLGVRYLPIDASVASQFNLSQTSGAYIPSADQLGQAPIVSGSPAEKAGLQAKDIISAVNGTTINSSHSLSTLLNQHSVGETINLTVIRAGKTITVNATLQAAPATN